MKGILLTVLIAFNSNICLSQKIFDVDDYLYAGSDTKAIREALIVAREFKGQKVLQFSNRVYSVDPSEIISDIKRNLFLYPIFSDLTISGYPNTELKLKREWPQKHKKELDNFILFGSKQFISGLAIKKIKIDFNGANVITKSGNLNNAFLFLTKGQNISVSDVIVLNNPGRQSIYVGEASKTGEYLTTDVVITRCQFINNADNVYGSKQNDHSTIYVAAKNAKITHNIVTSGNKLSRVATGIEVHTINSEISFNTITNYSTGVNIVGTAGDQVRTVYSNNTFRNVRKAFVFWGKKNRKIDEIKIVNNTIYQAEVNDPIIRMSGSLNTYIGSLEIENNILSTMGGLNKQSKYGHGIEITYVKNIRINNNVFKNLNGRAITLGGTNFIIDTMLVTNNTFENINAAKNIKYKYIIEFKAVGAIGKLSIRNNSSDRPDYFFDVGKSIKIHNRQITRNILGH